MRVLSNSYKTKDWGLLILRVGIGSMFVFHGLPKIVGGSEKWHKIGEAVKFMGITQFYEFWGYMAAFAEFGGGILLMFGLLHRFVSLLLFLTMMVASVKHIAQGDDFVKSSHALESTILFFSLILIGPGKLSFDQLLFRSNS